jgi:hypothetical protein
MLPIQLTQRNIFLFDGLGALLSTLVTGFVFLIFSEALGLPPSLLHCLAVLPLVFIIYSLCCSRLAKQIKPWMLLGIAIANLFYCLVSGGIILFYESITAMGMALLGGEIAVVLAIVAVELKLYRDPWVEKY